MVSLRLLKKRPDDPIVITQTKLHQSPHALPLEKKNTASYLLSLVSMKILFWNIRGFSFFESGAPLDCQAQ